MAGEFKKEFGYDIPIGVLTEKVSEEAQLGSQFFYMRALCVVSLLFSIDDEKRPQLYKIDPAGHYCGYKATSTGEKEAAASSNLEKELRKETNKVFSDPMKTAIKILQDVN
jgi:20S proteasome subunit alpha 1